MSEAEHTDAVAAATGIVSRAHMKALAKARANPESTWIDAACAIGAAQSQLLAAHPRAPLDQPDEGAGRHTCIELLEQAKRRLARIPAGRGPVSLALIRA